MSDFEATHDNEAPLLPYSWKWDFYIQLGLFHKRFEKALQSAEAQRWTEYWRPLIKRFLAPLLDLHQAPLVSMVCFNANRDLDVLKMVGNSEAFRKDCIYFSLSDTQKDTQYQPPHLEIEELLQSFDFNASTTASDFDVHAVTLLLIPLRLYGIFIIEKFIRRDLRPNIEYWHNINNGSIWSYILYRIYNIPNLIIYRLSLYSVDSIQYDQGGGSFFPSHPTLFSPLQRFTLLSIYGNKWTRFMGLWVRSISEILEKESTRDISNGLDSLFDNVGDIFCCRIDPAKDVIQNCQTCFSAVGSFRSRFLKQSIFKHLKRPNWLIRSWFPMSVTYILMRSFVSFTWVNKDWISESFNEIAFTARSFWSNWIKDPLLEIWHTIRYDDSKIVTDPTQSFRSRKFSISQVNSLQEDLDSLERMILQFSREHPELLEPNIQDRSPNMSIILKQYENELVAPIKNALMGDLLRLILIQIQKSKVDMQVALSAVDRLLKSNELNFEFLAVFPTLMLLYLLFKRIRKGLTKAASITKEEILARLERDIHHLNYYVLHKADRDSDVLKEYSNDSPTLYIGLSLLSILDVYRNIGIWILQQKHLGDISTLDGSLVEYIKHYVVDCFSYCSDDLDCQKGITVAISRLLNSTRLWHESDMIMSLEHRMASWMLLDIAQLAGCIIKDEYAEYKRHILHSIESTIYYMRNS
jgi:hypothetical protein